uniref:Uncharacterized protein n=1 Tax=Rhizophora mucronata TaxID=61149 RepID=A0A2P2NAY3_RHIMU
MLMIDFLLCSF